MRTRRTPVLLVLAVLGIAGLPAAGVTPQEGGPHEWCSGKHARVLQERCGLCHKGREDRPADVVPVCTQCHDAFKRNKHPRLRHAISAPRDPLRPARKFDCVSCHDPHCPRPLGRLRPEERREWCKGCHVKK